MKNKKIKELLIQQLKNTPIVQIACKKAGIGRSSFYRWKKDDKEFAEAADLAILEGMLLVNDMAESQLLSAIREQKLGAIVFWLKHHHPSYATKLEITARLKKPDEKLTPKQKAIIKKALRLASLSKPIKKLSKEKHEKSEH